MSKWPVFITAPNATVKDLNKAFLLLQDFEFLDNPSESQWVLFPYNKLGEEEKEKIKTLPFSIPPLPEEKEEADSTAANGTRRAFENYTLDQVNAFMKANEGALEAADYATANWLVIDGAGLANDTAIVVERVLEVDEDDEDPCEDVPGERGERFRAARLPCSEAWSMASNLDISNMDFEDWVDEDAGVQDDGTWNWCGPFPPSNEALERTQKEVAARREKAVQELREKGHIV